MRRTNGQKTQMINTIVGCPATLRFGVVQDRLRYLSEKDALRRKRPFVGRYQSRFDPERTLGIRRLTFRRSGPLKGQRLGSVAS
jgi:hypothetical protein